MEFYRATLHEELQRRCTRNSQYSLRSFAKFLDIEGSTLSRILNQTTIPSLRTAKQICERLELKPATTVQFINSVNRTLSSRNEAELPDELQYRDFDPQSDGLQLFDLMLMELLNCEGIDRTLSGLSRYLGVDEEVAHASLKKLTAAGHATESNGSYGALKQPMYSHNREDPSSWIRGIVQESLAAAQRAVNDFSPNTHKFETMTFAIDPKLLPEARERIEQFVADMDHFLQHDKHTEVYHLNVSLFPLRQVVSSPDLQN